MRIKTKTFYTCLALLLIQTVFASDGAISEFLDKEVKSISTQGNTKSKNLNITLDYPKSWNVSGGKRPNTLFNLTSDNGRGLESCNLVIKSLNLPDGYIVTKKDIDDLYSINGIKTLLPAESRYMDGGKTIIDGEPAGWSNYFTITENASVKIIAIASLYFVYYDKNLILLTCAVGDKTTISPEKLMQRFQNHTLLFQLVANSIVIHNKWN